MKARKTKVKFAETGYSLIIDDTIFTCLLLRLSNFIIININCSNNSLIKYIVHAAVPSKRSLCLIFSLEVTLLLTPSDPATNSQCTLLNHIGLNFVFEILVSVICIFETIVCFTPRQGINHVRFSRNCLRFGSFQSVSVRFSD